MRELWIGRQQFHWFAHGRRHDEPIERVLVMVLEILYRNGMFRGDGQFDKSAFQAGLTDFIQVDREFPQADLDCHLPECCSADVNIRGLFNQLPGFAR